jgi:2-polyprenyl-3-methyl-5-hydroxy-6-metoxy-1,4-benzoquinol methylase
MKTADEMIALNREQAKYYDSICAVEATGFEEGYSKTEKANWLTRIWAALRYRQQLAVKEAGIADVVRKGALDWAGAKAGGSCLEIGCFSGSSLTMPLAAMSASFTGVELSPKAVEVLNRRFKDSGLAAKAKAVAVDFLALDESSQYDIIYTSGVLHHFENPVPLFEKISRLSRPGGILIFVEPSQVNPLYRLIRACYRPFQSDSGWEWPFSKRTVAALESRFEPVAGFGWGKWSLPLSVLTAMPLIGGVVTRCYVRQVRREIAGGLNGKVWLNSYVAAVFKKRAN